MSTAATGTAVKVVNRDDGSRLVTREGDGARWIERTRPDGVISRRYLQAPLREGPVQGTAELTDAAGSRYTDPFVTTKPATANGGEWVELRKTAKQPVTVRMTRRAWDELRDLAAESEDGDETAGFLFGERTSATEVSISYPTHAVHDRQRTGAKLDVGKAALESIYLTRLEADPRLGERGSWHTHPYDEATRIARYDGTPSQNDLQSFLSAHDLLGTPYLGLILTPEHRGEFGVDWGFKPERTRAWIVRRESSGAPVAEPATFVVA